MATGQDVATAALRYVGVPYLWNGKTSSGLDCSGLVHLTLADLGVPFVHGSGAQIAACDPIDVDLAWATPGALLWREGHDALVTDVDQSVEAIVPAVALLARSDTYDGGKVRFTHAGLIPGIDYQEADVALPKITSPFGPRRIVVQGQVRTYPHRGLDLRSRKGDRVISLFDAIVVKTQSGRLPGAPIGRPDANGTPALADTLSGDGMIARRLDGGGYYVEAHLDPDVKVGDRLYALVTDIGITNESGQIDGAHRHVELWRAFDPDSYFDPTATLRAAAAGIKGSNPAPTTPDTPAEQEDDMPYTPQELQQFAAEGALQALDGTAGRKIIRELIREQTDPIPTETARITLGSWIGKGVNRRTIAQAIAGAKSAAEAALTILTRKD